MMLFCILITPVQCGDLILEVVIHVLSGWGETVHRFQEDSDQSSVTTSSLLCSIAGCTLLRVNESP